MSVFSGKCDLYDSLIMIQELTEEELKNNVVIYVGDSKEPLVINSIKDIIPYYPHLIGSGAFGGRSAIVYITSESFVDIEERERLELYKEELLRIYNRCKRKKEPFDVKEAISQVCWRGYAEEPITELAERVAKSGKMATIEGLHMPMSEYYREKLAEEMMKNGINPVEFGYGRFLHGLKGGKNEKSW